MDVFSPNIIYNVSLYSTVVRNSGGTRGWLKAYISKCYNKIKTKSKFTAKFYYKIKHINQCSYLQQSPFLASKWRQKDGLNIRLIYD